MKKLFTTLFSILTASVMMAQTIDTVSCGAGISKQVYYSLLNGIQASEDNDDWDIAFQTSSQFSVSIMINPATETELYLYNGDTSDWNADWTGLDSTWLATNTSRLYNSDTSWEHGAFARYQNFPNYTWGMYNFTTHQVWGHKIFVIKLSNGVYQKVWIESLISGVYTFRHASLDNMMDMQHQVKQSDYAGKNFAYYSLQQHKAVDKEPMSTDWDLYFGKFTGYVPTPYPVTGVLHSLQTMSSKAYPVDDSTYGNWQAHELDSSMNIIGHDWKTFNMGTFQYDIADSTVYFVRTQHNDVFKLVFTHYGGSTTGDIVFNKTQVHFSGLEEEVKLSLFDIYPNPANDIINIAYQSNEAAIVEFYNLSGNKILSNNLRANALTQMLDVSSLDAGFYIMTITSGTERISRKIVIE